VLNIGNACMYQNCVDSVTIITLGSFLQNNGFYKIFLLSVYVHDDIQIGTWYTIVKDILYKKKLKT